MVLAVNLTQKTIQHVKHDRSFGIAEMGAVINGGTADIHTHVVLVNRGKFLFAAQQRIVQADFHFLSPNLLFR